MHLRGITAGLLVLCALAACGGKSSTPQSERNAYGRTVAQMQAAPASAATSGGAVTVRAVGLETTLFVPDAPSWEFNPTTGAYTPSVNFSGESYPTWYVAVGLVNSSGEVVVTDWTVRTLWVLQGANFVSARQLFSKDGKTFGAAYPNPPFSTADTTAIVELVQGDATQLLAASITWSR
jgi:hypothetical protein